MNANDESLFAKCLTHGRGGVIPPPPKKKQIKIDDLMPGKTYCLLAWSNRGNGRAHWLWAKLVFARKRGRYFVWQQKPPSWSINLQGCDCPSIFEEDGKESEEENGEEHDDGVTLEEATAIAEEHIKEATPVVEERKMLLIDTEEEEENERDTIEEAREDDDQKEQERQEQARVEIVEMEEDKGDTLPISKIYNFRDREGQKIDRLELVGRKIKKQQQPTQQINEMEPFIVNERFKILMMQGLEKWYEAELKFYIEMNPDVDEKIIVQRLQEGKKHFVLHTEKFLGQTPKNGTTPRQLERQLAVSLVDEWKRLKCQYDDVDVNMQVLLNEMKMQNRQWGTLVASLDYEQPIDEQMDEVVWPILDETIKQVESLEKMKIRALNAIDRWHQTELKIELEAHPEVDPQIIYTYFGDLKTQFVKHSENFLESQIAQGNMLDGQQLMDALAEEIIQKWKALKPNHYVDLDKETLTFDDVGLVGKMDEPNMTVLDLEKPKTKKPRGARKGVSLLERIKGPNDIDVDTQALMAEVEAENRQWGTVVASLEDEHQQNAGFAHCHESIQRTILIDEEDEDSAADKVPEEIVQSLHTMIEQVEQMDDHHQEEINAGLAPVDVDVAKVKKRRRPRKAVSIAGDYIAPRTRAQAKKSMERREALTQQLYDESTLLSQRFGEEKSSKKAKVQFTEHFILPKECRD